jgi:hypothetical protein
MATPTQQFGLPPLMVRSRRQSTPYRTWQREAPRSAEPTGQYGSLHAMPEAAPGEPRRAPGVGAAEYKRHITEGPCVTSVERRWMNAFVPAPIICGMQMVGRKAATRSSRSGHASLLRSRAILRRAQLPNPMQGGRGPGPPKIPERGNLGELPDRLTDPGDKQQTPRQHRRKTRQGAGETTVGGYVRPPTPRTDDAPEPPNGDPDLGHALV